MEGTKVNRDRFGDTSVFEEFGSCGLSDHTGVSKEPETGDIRGNEGCNKEHFDTQFDKKEISHKRSVRTCLHRILLGRILPRLLT